MTNPPLLDPHGSAKLAFLEGFASSPLSDEESLRRRLFDVLSESVRKFNVEPSLVNVAWQACRMDQHVSQDERWLLFFLFLAVLVSEQQGNTRLPATGPQAQYLKEMFDLLLEDQLKDRGWTGSRLLEGIGDLLSTGKAAEVIGGPDEYKPLIHEGDYVWTHRMRLLEERFTDRIARYCQSIDVDGQRLQSGLAEVAGKKGKRGVVLNKEQRQAVELAASSQLCIISGGPGTGKTTIVVAILRLLAYLGVEMDSIALAAPTGKAANRMQESIRSGLNRVPSDQWSASYWKVRDGLGTASTLHRLLGYSPGDGSFRHHENNRLSETTVIVDEASMIDIHMIERLVRSLRDDARLILLGDSEQLPSVDAGAILRDLTRSTSPSKLLQSHVVRLRESMRMDPSDPSGRHILLTARHLNEGRVPEYRTPQQSEPEHALIVRDRVEDLTFQGVEFLDVPSSDHGGSAQESAKLRTTVLEHWYDRFLSDPRLTELSEVEYLYTSQGFDSDQAPMLKELFDRLASFRILCLTRSYRTGVESTNEALHYRQLRSREQSQTAFLPGEPILMNKNDYDRMVFNGDQGMTLQVQYEGRPQLMAVFPRDNSFVPFHIDSLRGRITLAYAMTVHKSQGSEFNHALLLLPEKDLPINSRELLYTAITRCKTSVTAVGDRDVLKKGTLRKIDRFTGIGDALQRRERDAD